MFIARLSRGALFFCVIILFYAPGLDLQAHPVAQGSMTIIIAEREIDVTARVTNEEIIVEQTFGAGLTTGAFTEKARRHAAYFLKHLVIDAGGVKLSGELVNIETPQTGGSGSSLVTYQLRFPVTGPRPQTVTVSEDLLREIDFAPGNPWEATFVTGIGLHNGVRQDGRLLSYREPVRFQCDWPAASAVSSGSQQGQNSQPAAHLDRLKLVSEYVWHGVMHIATGYDHMLFMAALVLGAATFWDLVKVVTAFTIAHSVTLTLAVLGYARLPSSIVEPFIAGSIVFVAVQNVIWPMSSRGRGRLVAAFGFGLFHGLGFAGGLLDAMANLSGIATGLAIVAFSLGVELGHQLVVIPLFSGLKIAQNLRPKRATAIALFAQRWGSALISCAGMFYLVAALREP